MSDVSDGAFDVFVTCANPEVVNTSHGYNTRNVRSPPRLSESPIPEDDEDEDSANENNGNEDEEDGEDNGEDEEDDEEDDEGDEEDDEDIDGNNEEREDANETEGRDNLSGVYEEYESDNENIPVYPKSEVSRLNIPPPSGGFTNFLKEAPTGEKTAQELQSEAIEKQSMITDLQRLRDGHGITLSKNWTMDDDIDSISFELKRLMLHVDEINNISVMRNGLQLACTGLEMFSKKFKVLDLEGWSAEVCSDMSKYDRSLGKWYRKYWRRSHSNSPEADIALSLVGSIGMYHMRKTMSKKIFQRGGGMNRNSQFQEGSRFQSQNYDDDDDDEEEPPF